MIIVWMETEYHEVIRGNSSGKKFQKRKKRKEVNKEWVPKETFSMSKVTITKETS